MAMIRTLKGKEEGWGCDRDRSWAQPQNSQLECWCYGECHRRSVLHLQEFDTLAVSLVLWGTIHLLNQQWSPLNSQRRMLKKIDISEVLLPLSTINLNGAYVPVPLPHLPSTSKWGGKYCAHGRRKLTIKSATRSQMSGADRKCHIPQLSSKTYRAVRRKGHCTYYLELQKAKLVVFSVLKEMVFVGPCMQSTLGSDSDLGEDPVCGRWRCESAGKLLGDSFQCKGGKASENRRGC